MARDAGSTRSTTFSGVPRTSATAASSRPVRSRTIGFVDGIARDQYDRFAVYFGYRRAGERSAQGWVFAFDLCAHALPGGANLLQRNGAGGRCNRTGHLGFVAGGNGLRRAGGRGVRRRRRFGSGAFFQRRNARREGIEGGVFGAQDVAQQGRLEFEPGIAAGSSQRRGVGQHAQRTHHGRLGDALSAFDRAACIVGSEVALE